MSVTASQTRDETGDARLIGFRAAFREVVCSPTFQFLAASAAAFLVLFARCPVNLLLPSFYAEDSHWTSLIFTHGFWSAVWLAKKDYFVFGNVGNLWLGLKFVEFFRGGNLLDIPFAHATVAMLFAATVVSLPFLLLRDIVQPSSRLLLWLMLCLIPLGTSEAEVLGKPMNIGYLFLFLGLQTAIFRVLAARSWWHFLLSDLCLALCIATNPLCLLLLPVAFCGELARIWRKRAAPPLPALFGLVLVTAVSLMVLWRMVSFEKVEISPGSVVPPLTFRMAVQIGVARNILHPVVWPLFSHLTTSISLVLLGLLVGAVFRFGRRTTLRWYAVCGSLLGATSCALVFLRPGLREFSLSYASTLPDRYYYGHNMIACLLFVLLLQDGASRLKPSLARLVPWAASVAVVLAFCLCGSYLGISPQQIESVRDATFVERVEDALLRHDFVNAHGAPRPEGAFLRVSTPITNRPAYLPRASLESSKR